MIEVKSFEIQRQAHIGSFEFDVLGKYLMCSDETFELCGIKHDDLSGTEDAIHPKFHSDDMENILQICMLAIDENCVREFNYRIKSSVLEGQIVHVQFAPVFNDAKECIRVLGTVRATVEHSHTNSALKENENLYRTFFDSSKNIIILKDARFRHILANKAFADFLGKPESEIIGKTDFDLFPKEIAQEHLMRESTAILSGSSIVSEEINGNRIFEATKFPIEISEHTIGVGGIIRDITARRQSERALIHERNRAEMYLDIAGVIIGAVDLNDAIILMNNDGCKLLGYSKEDLMGKPWTADFVTEYSRENTRHILAEICSGNVGDYINYENSIITAGGEERVISWRNVALRNESGEIIGVLGSGIDVTEQRKTFNALRESERSKSVLLSHLPGMAYRCSYDPDWTMQFLSEGCYALTGYKTESFIHNRDLSYNDIICDEYRKPLWDEWTRTLAAKEPFRYEYEINPAEGGKKWVWEMGQGVFGKNGSVEALEGIVIDITESKQQSIQIQHINDHDALTGLYNRSYYERAKERLEEEGNLPLSIIMADINGLRSINDDFGLATGDLLITETSKLLQKICSKNDILARTGGGEFSIISPDSDYNKANEIRKAIKNSCEEYNSSVKNNAHELNLSIGYGVRLAKETRLEETEREAESFVDRQKLLNKKSHHSTILSSIMATMYARSNETEEHATRLGQISKMIGEKMNLTQSSLDELQLFSMLHDIGKIGIDDRILNKPGKLTPSEWERMKKHPEIGYVITMSSPEFAPIAKYVLSHHESWDGTGYPAGLRGVEIPLLARILAVADAYDAMTEDRVYRKALTKEAAINEIRKNAGTQFDPEIAKIFVDNASMISTRTEDDYTE